MPAFEGMKAAWEELKDTLPEAAHIIQPGLEKLAQYKEYAQINTVYTLATCAHFFLAFLAIFLRCF